MASFWMVRPSLMAEAMELSQFWTATAPLSSVWADVASVETRLAKLVLMMCQSHEVKQLIDATFKDDVRYAVTTAFSMHPVSMKYRGVYKLHKRLEGEKGEGFRLNYYGELGLWSLDEAYALWWKKFHN